MGAHSSLPAGPDASTCENGKGRHRRGKRNREPYAWLGAGALTVGFGAAALTGAGIAQADDGSSGGSSSSASSSSGDSSSSAGASSHAPSTRGAAKAESKTSSTQAPGSDAAAEDSSDAPKSSAEASVSKIERPKTALVQKDESTVKTPKTPTVEAPVNAPKGDAEKAPTTQSVTETESSTTTYKQVAVETESSKVDAPTTGAAITATVELTVAKQAVDVPPADDAPAVSTLFALPAAAAREIEQQTLTPAISTSGVAPVSMLQSAAATTAAIDYSDDEQWAAYIAQFKALDPNGIYYHPGTSVLAWARYNNISFTEESFRQYVESRMESSFHATTGFDLTLDGDLKYTNTHDVAAAVLYYSKPEMMTIVNWQPNGMVLVEPGETVILPNPDTIAHAFGPLDSTRHSIFASFAAAGYGTLVRTTDPDPGDGGSGGNPGTNPGGQIGGYENFWDALRNGVSLASWATDAVEVITKGAVKVASWGAALVVTGFVSGIYDVFKGIVTFDPGTTLSGWIDIGSGFVGVVGGTVGVAAALGVQLTKFYASFWVPLTNDQQIGFLNHVAQCYYGKNTNDLDSVQANDISKRYDGLWGYANLLSDYSRYNTRGIASFFGGNGCP